MVLGPVLFFKLNFKKVCLFHNKLKIFIRFKLVLSRGRELGSFFKKKAHKKGETIFNCEITELEARTFHKIRLQMKVFVDYLTNNLFQFASNITAKVL